MLGKQKSIKINNNRKVIYYHHNSIILDSREVRIGIFRPKKSKENEKKQ